MGLLSEGSALSWEETQKYADHVRKHGIAQFINQYNKLKDRTGDCLLWGDEVEYMLVKLDPEARTARLLLDAPRILPELQKDENEGVKDLSVLWRPEYAAYMIEGTPGKPYGHRMANFNQVEANMKVRRQQVESQLLNPGETTLCLTSFPRLGCPNFSEPLAQPTPTEGTTRSLFFPDEAIFPSHPRFHTLSRNIRQRRKAKVAINMPIYRDIATPEPFIEDLSKYGADQESLDAAKPDHVYMDAMGFGMGCSCLQMTFQAVNLNEARVLYDQLTPLCPIIMALSAASPIHRGYLCDTDCRWNVIAASVDDRTAEERGEKPLKENQFQINKSRYDSIDSYLSCSKYNDINVVYDREIYQKLRDAGIDHLLAQHFAHLFIRDPVSLFKEKIDQDDETDTDHFENIQSTNWQTMRFKPPPPGSPIGWRVEFRPCEVQLTDFENAAFVVFIVLMTRVILSFRLDQLIPISMVDENIKTAQQKDAVRTGKFWYRKDILTEFSPGFADCTCSCAPGPNIGNGAGNTDVHSDKCKDLAADDQDGKFIKMTINEIINGKGDTFPGLIPIFKKYLESVDDCDVETNCTITQYLNLISMRASGELMTTARYIREFVTQHPQYKKDSVVSEEVNYDLMCECARITQGDSEAPGLLKDVLTMTNERVPDAMKKTDCLINKKLGCALKCGESCP